MHVTNCVSYCHILSMLEIEGSSAPNNGSIIKERRQAATTGGRRGASNNGILVDLDHLLDLSSQ